MRLIQSLSSEVETKLAAAYRFQLTMQNRHLTAWNHDAQADVGSVTAPPQKILQLQRTVDALPCSDQLRIDRTPSQYASFANVGVTEPPKFLDTGIYAYHISTLGPRLSFDTEAFDDAMQFEFVAEST